MMIAEVVQPNVIVVCKRVAEGEIRCSLDAPKVASRNRLACPQYGRFTGPFDVPQEHNLAIHTIRRIIGQQNHHLLQHQRSLKEEFEEGHLASTPFEIPDNQ